MTRLFAMPKPYSLDLRERVVSYVEAGHSPRAPFGHWKTQTFVAGLRCGALTAPWVIDAPMDRAIFDTYVRTQLVPTLHEGDIVILDNLPAHKSPAAEQAIRDRGAWLMFLPPYSPDLNP